MKYKVKYFFDGYGRAIIEAKNEEEAKDMFFEGEFRDEKESGDNYNIDKVEEVKE